MHVADTSSDLDLRLPVFQHGGLYVALSRLSHPQNLKVMLPATSEDFCTKNIVYEALVADLHQAN
eukprot:m.21725 g.21725  ORF g.21725 m.21725 type:complete len:65 (+) comp11156_c0_seq13:166-360(+)